MSETTAAGSGGSPAPGWYADPSDPSLLRWWSGEAWTEHVSAAPAAEPAVPAEPAYPVAAQPVAPQPVAEQPVAEQPVAPQLVAAEPAIPEPFASPFAPPAQEPAAPTTVFPAASQQPTSVVQPGDPLPSRRALREPWVDPSSVAQPTDSFASTESVTPPVVSDQVAPPVLTQPSAPVPTLPVQPTSFLEQAGYAPLDGAPVPSTAPAPEPVAFEPVAAVVPEAAPVAPAAPQAFTPPPPQAFQPPVQHQVQPLQADAWDQAAQDAGSFAGIAPVPGQWTEPLAPAESELPGVPAAAAPTVGLPAPTAVVPPVTPGAVAPGSIDALLGTAPASLSGAMPPVGEMPAAGLGLVPAASTAEPGVGRRADEDAISNTGGSSTVWSWLIALSPIIAAGAIGYVIASTGYVTTGWPIEAAVAAPYLLVALFALADRAALITLGHSQPRSPAWALLSAPVYLIIRASETRREDGTGTGLTLIWFISFLVGLGGFIGYGFLTHHALIAGLPS